MIKPGEIQKMANSFGVRDQQIEKDYVLSWILQGIANQEDLSKLIVFKGGTVLKKVYFEDYRFSEDLDFTQVDDNIPTTQIFDWFKKVFDYVQEEANIPLEIIDNNQHQDGGINFYISYIGPLGGQGNSKRVKVDISLSEKLVFKSVFQKALLTYTDQTEYFLLCYPLEEVLVEKLRAVLQRMQARDFYDIWYLLEIHQMDAAKYINEFKQKCVSKNINPNDFHQKLVQRLPQYKGQWQTSMAGQIKDLPDFEQVEREVSRNLRKFQVT